MAFDQFHDRFVCPSCATLTARLARVEAERDEARGALVQAEERLTVSTRLWGAFKHQRDTLRELLQELEYSEASITIQQGKDVLGMLCPVCHRRPHDPGCRLGAALVESK